MITLYQAPRAWGTANISPFCIKLEAYLRMAELPYEIKPGDPRKAPKGKVPYVQLEGAMLGDSSVIIERLKERFGDSVDAHLSVEQKALGRLVQRTLEEGTYWCGVYARWAVDDAFEEIRKALFGSFMGPPLIWFVPDLVRKKALSSLFAQGTSRHAPEQVYAMANRDVAAIDTLITGPYLFGERPTSYDAVTYAFTSALWRTPFAKPFGPCPPKVLGLMEAFHTRYFADIK